MDQVLSAVVPVFALIALGYAAGRTGYIGEATSQGLADFTFKMAIPAMLFHAMATAELPDVSPLAVWGCYFAVVFACWSLATLLARYGLQRPLSDSAPIAMSAGFGNVVMLGIPLAISAFGEAATGPIALVISVHSPVLWALASIHLALTNTDAAKAKGGVAKALWTDLSRNTLILAILAGTVWRLTGIGLHPVASDTIYFLGRAAIPCALVALGLSLIKFKIKGQTSTLTMILALKLVLMPVVAWWLATALFALPAVSAGVVIIFAAMPTGANAFLFAMQAGRAMNSASAAVALGTGLSLITSVILLSVLSPA